MTAKELAKQLGISAAAVSMALNNRPGVSTQTRNRVKEAAAAAGIDMTRFNTHPNLSPIYLIAFIKNGAVLTDTSFFSELIKGVEQGCSEQGYRVNFLNCHGASELERQLADLRVSGAAGIILLATEMKQEDFGLLAFTDIPIIILDNHYITSKFDSVQISNADGAYMATNYLISKRKTQPGYLHSSYPINNFYERFDGFCKALVHNGMSKSSAVVHKLSPSADGAFSDMDALIKNGEKLSDCYFADNDLIAIGAMRAFKENGYKIPEDISIIGFDDISLCNYTDPGLTTVHVPKYYMGNVAARRLIDSINDKITYPINIQISVHLVVRNSIR